MNKFSVLVCVCFLVACGDVRSSDDTGFKVDCQQLNDLVGIDRIAEKFERLDGAYGIDAEFTSLDKLGFDVSIPVVKNSQLQILSSTEARLMFGSHNVSNLSVYPYEINYSARSYFEKILHSSVLHKYNNISVFDFLLASLGKQPAKFNCEQQDRAVAMFVSSYVKSFNKDGVFVYYIEPINSLLFVSKSEQFGMLKFVYQKGLDALIFVNIEGSPENLAELLRSLTTEKRSVPAK